MKICSKCKNTKPLAEFSKNGPYFHSHCKMCKNRAHKKRYYENPEKERIYRFIHRYGITLKEVRAMYTTQNKLCPICGGKMKFGGNRNNSAHVDHDHKTQVVRGVICAACNRLLGAAKDNIWTLHKAIEYLSGLPRKSNVVKW